MCAKAQPPTLFTSAPPALPGSRTSIKSWLWPVPIQVRLAKLNRDVINHIDMVRQEVVAARSALPLGVISELCSPPATLYPKRGHNRITCQLTNHAWECSPRPTETLVRQTKLTGSFTSSSSLTPGLGRQVGSGAKLGPMMS